MLMQSQLPELLQQTLQLARPGLCEECFTDTGAAVQCWQSIPSAFAATLAKPCFIPVQRPVSLHILELESYSVLKENETVTKFSFLGSFKKAVSYCEVEESEV